MELVLLSVVILGVAAGFPAPRLVHLCVAVVAPSPGSSSWLIKPVTSKFIQLF